MKKIIGSLTLTFLLINPSLGANNKKNIKIANNANPTNYIYNDENFLPTSPQLPFPDITPWKKSQDSSEMEVSSYATERAQQMIANQIALLNDAITKNTQEIHESNKLKKIEIASQQKFYNALTEKLKN